MTLVSPHTGYDYRDIYSEEPETYESSGRADFTMTKEENDALNFRLICAAILIAGATSAGCAAFRRKNLR